MLPKNRIPRPTVKRLSLYLRELETQQEHGQQTISSKQLGEALGFDLRLVQLHPQTRRIG